MDANTVRWAQIVFWDRDDLVRLHGLESWLEMRLPPIQATRRRILDLGEERERALFRSLQDRYGLVPFWPDKMPPDARAAAMAAFERAIYPLWASIKKRDDELDADPNHAPVREIETLHAQDLAIFKNSDNPNGKPDRRFAATKDAGDAYAERRR